MKKKIEYHLLMLEYCDIYDTHMCVIDTLIDSKNSYDVWREITNLPKNILVRFYILDEDINLLDLGLDISKNTYEFMMHSKDKIINNFILIYNIQDFDDIIFSIIDKECKTIY